MRPEFDERDQKILEERQAAYEKREGFTCGDYVIFSCGTKRRISHVWSDGVQTGNGGSFYLSDGGVSFSGGLYRSVPKETLKLTESREMGSAWFFHHDHPMAHNGVYFSMPFRVWKCSEVAPKY